MLCIAASFASEYQSYYVPEHQPQLIRSHYDDDSGYGHLAIHEHDQDGRRHLETVNDIHGARGYDHGDRQALRDIGQHGYVNQGAHANLHASGAKGNQVRQAHDRGFYEKEKKYGFEKGYGYERETQHRDAADNFANHGDRYNHNENRAQYNQKGNALRDLALLNNKYNRGAENYANRNVLVDLRGARNRGKDVESDYDNMRHLRAVQVIPRREPLRPVILQRYIPDIDHSNRFRYMGLGGLMSYGQGYGYNPISYGYSP